MTGKSYEKLLQEYIFDVAGMKNSGVDITKNLLEKRAYGYHRQILNNLENSPFLDMSFVLGAGNLYSMVDDMFLFNKALFWG